MRDWGWRESETLCAARLTRRGGMFGWPLVGGEADLGIYIWGPGG